MKGCVHQINIGNGGVPKEPVLEARVTTERLEGDDWNYHSHGGAEQAVCLYALECLEKLRKQGLKVFSGALGENITTEGIDYSKVRIGDIYRVGNDVEIQITKVRTPCGTIAKAYGQRIREAMWDKQIKQGDVTSPKWGMTGFYARVLQEGMIKQGDRIEKVETS